MHRFRGQQSCCPCQKRTSNQWRRGLACVDARRDAVIRIVNARGDPVAAICLYGCAAATESRKNDHGAKGE